MKLRAATLCILIYAAIATAATAATPIYVDPAAADDNGAGTSAAAAKKTIAAAYTAVDSGGEIYLLAGTYDTTTQGASWYVAFSANKSVTIKPDPATSPTITLSTAPTLASLNWSAGAAGTTQRIEGVTITPTAGTRVATFGASFVGAAEVADCVINGGSRDITNTAASTNTRTQLWDGCTITTSAATYWNAIATSAALTIRDCTITTTSTSTSVNEGLIKLSGACGTVTVSGNTITGGETLFNAHTNATWTSATIAGNTIAWTPNGSIRCIYFRDDAADSRENVVIRDNVITVAATAYEPYVITIGLSDEYSTATAYPAPKVVGNRITTADTGDGTAMWISAGCANAIIANNECSGFAYTVRLEGTYGATVADNYIEGGLILIVPEGGGKHIITGNHLVPHDYTEAEPGRAILCNRLIKATSTATTAYTATKVTDTGADPWASEDGYITAGLIAMVNDGTSWYEPLQWGIVQSITGDEVTVDAWHVFDDSGDTATPTDGHVCKIIQFPQNLYVSGNIIDATDASYGFTFDFTPVDPESYWDWNIYRPGTSVLTNLGSHMTAGSPADLADLQTMWPLMSASHPANDAHSTERLEDTERLVRCYLNRPRTRFDLRIRDNGVWELLHPTNGQTAYRGHQREVLDWLKRSNAN